MIDIYTIRDRFAAKAMQAMIEDHDANPDNPESIAEAAYQMADAMLVEREKPSKPIPAEAFTELLQFLRDFTVMADCTCLTEKCQGTCHLATCRAAIARADAVQKASA